MLCSLISWLEITITKLFQNIFVFQGTPLYMSPELVQEKPYDHNSDLWFVYFSPLKFFLWEMFCHFPFIFPMTLSLMYAPWLTLHLLRILNSGILLFIHFFIHSFTCPFIFLLLLVASFLYSSKPCQLFCPFWKVNYLNHNCNIHFLGFCHWVTSFLNADFT